MTPLPLCATIIESSTEAVVARMDAVSGRCDWIEVRLDAAPDLDLERIVAARPRPLVVTCRPPREGGRHEGDEASRLARLRAAARLGAEAVDVEWDAVDALGELPPKTQLVVSRHAFDATRPERFEALLASVRAPRASIQKLAVGVAGAEDALHLLRLAAREARPTLAVAMGFRGVVSRLVGPLRAPFSYAAADPGAPAAPGQLSALRLRALLAGRSRSSSTELYGVIGAPVAHSRSPELMNAAFSRLGVDAVYTWLETDDPQALLREAGGALRGASVTIPHKVTCARLESVSPAPEVQALGALNTLVRAGAGWRGHNTDALAARALLARALGDLGAAGALGDLGAAGALVAVLGNGGAARAVAWAARELGCRVLLYARSLERARALAGALGVAAGGTLADVPRQGLAAIVNATSVGMQSDTDRSPVAPTVFGPGVVAYDLVYTPPETRFLRDARARGAPVVTGVEHFVAQARAQLALWLGEERVAGLDVGTLLESE